MFCTKCGKEAKEGEKFCSACGTSLTASKPSVEKQNEAAPVQKAIQPAQRPTQTVAKPVQSSAPADDSAKNMALIGFVCAFFCQIAGIIVSAMALKKYGQQKNQDGKGLATAGLVLSIVFIAGTVLVCIGYILLIALAYSGTYYSYSFFV